MCERQPPFSVNSGKGKPFQERHSDQTHVTARPRKRAPLINYGEGSGPDKEGGIHLHLPRERQRENKALSRACDNEDAEVSEAWQILKNLGKK